MSRSAIFAVRSSKTAFNVVHNNSNIRTPMNNVLSLPNETLALAVANEWRCNASKKKIDLKTMHLTTLAYRAIDNPFNETKETIMNSIIEYLRFDTLRFRDVDNQDLLNRQSRHWDPIIGWFEHKFDCHTPIEYGGIVSANSLPKRTEEIIHRHLDSHGNWALIGAEFMAKNLKSFVLTTCLTDRFLKVEQAVELARLEVRFQAEKWSEVEWEHDLDERCTNARVAAGCLFYHLSI